MRVDVEAVCLNGSLVCQATGAVRSLLRCDALLSSSYTFSAMGRRLFKSISLEGEWDCIRSPTMISFFVFLAKLLHKVSVILMGVVYVLMLVCYRNPIDTEWLTLPYPSIEGGH